jgi:hypothetical protein
MTRGGTGRRERCRDGHRGGHNAGRQTLNVRAATTGVQLLSRVERAPTGRQRRGDRIASTGREPFPPRRRRGGDRCGGSGVGPGRGAGTDRGDTEAGVVETAVRVLVEELTVSAHPSHGGAGAGRSPAFTVGSVRDAGSVRDGGPGRRQTWL